MKTAVAIVGGGLVGSLLAVFLRRRDYPVTIYEARPDPRIGPAAGGRSWGSGGYSDTRVHLEKSNWYDELTSR